MIQTAIVGTGVIGKEHLRAMSAVAGARVVAVCDRSAVMAEVAADRFGIDHWFTDFGEMLAALRPDVVHVTTPATTHVPLAQQALLAGCHVLVEKPIAPDLRALDELIGLADRQQRWLLEDHNYLWNHEMLRLREDIAAGAFGEIVHVDIDIGLDLFAPGSRFADPSQPHPALRAPAGAASDFLTHMAYLAHALIGPHRQVMALGRRDQPADSPWAHEVRGLVQAERGTAHLIFSGQSQPDRFWVRVVGTHRTAETNLFETGRIESRVFDSLKPLSALRNGWARAYREARGGMGSVWRKLGGGPGALDGLWEFVRQTYLRLESGNPPPVTPTALREVNALVQSLTDAVVESCVS